MAFTNAKMPSAEFCMTKEQMGRVLETKEKTQTQSIIYLLEQWVEATEGLLPWILHLPVTKMLGPAPAQMWTRQDCLSLLDRVLLQDLQQLRNQVLPQDLPNQVLHQDHPNLVQPHLPNQVQPQDLLSLVLHQDPRSKISPTICKWSMTDFWIVCASFVKNTWFRQSK